MVDVKSITVAMLFTSMIAFLISVFAVQTKNLFTIIVGFITFEVCVGVYFPSIGTLRSQLLPESHRPVIMSLFAVPLNILVLGVIFFHPTIGDIGALTIASFATGIATCCMLLLRWRICCEDELEKQRSLEAKENWMRLMAATMAVTKVAKKFKKNTKDPIKTLEESAKSVQYRNRRHLTFNSGSVC